MKRLYVVVKDGEWIQPIVRGYRMACCDCGLVHTVKFRVVAGRVQFSATRDANETRKVRRNRENARAALLKDAGR